jgi:hypothetical protein
VSADNPRDRIAEMRALSSDERVPNGMSVIGKGVKRVRYGLRCACHGVQIFESLRQRDAYAITYQCRLEWFRVVSEGEPEHATAEQWETA